MNKEAILTAVKSLGWQPGSYIVFGSAPMAMIGLRNAGDIDFLVNQELFEALQTQGWKQIEKSPTDKPLTHGDFEAHENWNFSTYKPTLQQLLATADIIDGIAFANIEAVKKWKQASGRPKDRVDVALIDAYLQTSN